MRTASAMFPAGPMCVLHKQREHALIGMMSSLLGEQKEYEVS